MLTSVLSAYRDEAEAKGGAFLRAWSRQATDALGYVLTRSDAPPLTLRDFPSANLVPAPETPKRSRIEPTVPNAPARPTLPASDEDEDEDHEIDHIEFEEETDPEPDPEPETDPKIFNVLTSSNFMLIVVILAWVLLSIYRG
jgi:hypothetical protein